MYIELFSVLMTGIAGFYLITNSIAGVRLPYKPNSRVLNKYVMFIIGFCSLVSFGYLTGI